MTQDAFLQVAPDSTGKRVSMDQTVDATGVTTYLQRALLVGDPADALATMVELNMHQLAVLRAILKVLTETSNSRVDEDDFSIFTQE